MMREILFRGKRLDNGDWVEGAFLNDRDGSFYICPAVSDISYGDGGNRRRIGCWYKVDPSTVGQYTGLKDKNGERIFEGDIIAVPYEEDRDPVEGIFIYYENGKVYFDETHFGWYVKFVGDELSLWEFDDCGVEIIGNIHDNPEFMKGDTANG